MRFYWSYRSIPELKSLDPDHRKYLIRQWKRRPGRRECQSWWSFIALFLVLLTAMVIGDFISTGPWIENASIGVGVILGTLCFQSIQLSVLRRWVREAPMRYPQCPHCHYDLRGSPVAAPGVCPECGEYVSDESDPLRMPPK